MFDNTAFASWTHLVVGGILFALLFELPLVLVDYLVEGTLGLRWSTVALGAAAFLGYVAVGRAIMMRSHPSDRGS